MAALARYGSYRRVICSEQLVPGYKFEYTHELSIGYGDDVILAEAQLPGDPLEDGTPTLRGYTLFSDGQIKFSRFRCPHPDRIRTVAAEVLSMVPVADQIGGFGSQLKYLIEHATDQRLQNNSPETLGNSTLLAPDEVEELNRELQALVQT